MACYYDVTFNTSLLLCCTGIRVGGERNVQDAHACSPSKCCPKNPGC